MRVSLNSIKQYTNVDLPVDELVAKINQQLGGVEKVIDLGGRYKDATIVKVVKCDKHPNADKLSVCEIDVGTGENVQVVCGAPNVREGIFVVWLPPKSTVPASFDDKEPFVLEPKELRGVVSNGMLASAKELGIGDDHSGILEIDPDEWKPSQVEIKPGASFAEAYGLNDTIIDIENKMFTHRPDLFGQIGVAREIAGIQHKQFTSPDWYKNVPEFKSAEGLALEVFNDAPDNVPRFMAVAIKDVEVKPSPLWLRCELVRLGGKPINNIVDVTNYIMLLTAQPTHAYDYDKLRGHRLGARMAKKGEKAELLNGKTYELDENDIVIVDGEGVVGLGGIMGGGNSEVSADTKNIVLEVANFDMYAVRKSSMRHGLFTDALTRFNKGQSPLQNPHVINLLMMSIHDVAGGEQASNVFDEHKSDFDEDLYVPVSLDEEFVNSRLGLKLSHTDIQKLLENVEFKVFTETDITVTKPFWRTDIELPEDVVEEVGRLYGYDKLPRELPRRSIKPAHENPDIKLKQAIRENLSKAGANEVLTYSFVHGKLLENAGQDPANAFKLTNALSPELQYYRVSLMPSLLAKVHMNIKAGYDEFVLFELGKAHTVGADDEDGLPREDELTGLVIAAADKLKKPGAAYYQARCYLQNLIGTKITYEPVPEEMRTFDITKPYDLDRTACAYVGETFIGLIGEFRNEVKRALKLPRYCAGFELDTLALQGVLDSSGYQPLSKFPSVTQDISLKVSADTSYHDVYQCVWDALAEVQSEDTLPALGPLSIYQPEAADTKTITLRFTIASYEKTLTDAEVATLLDHAADAAVKNLNAERV